MFSKNSFFTNIKQVLFREHCQISADIFFFKIYILIFFSLHIFVPSILFLLFSPFGKPLLTNPMTDYCNALMRLLYKTKCITRETRALQCGAMVNYD